MKTTTACLLALTLQFAHAFEVHEWGTFTSVAGSDGILLAGLQREEEVLPRFVHSHFGFENGQSVSREKLASVMKTHGYPAFTTQSKGMGRRPVTGVTVKMETPVIYFHSNTAFRAKVNVGFNGGTISQWYPARSGGETLPEPHPATDPINHPVPAEQWKIDFSTPYRGGIEWDVEVLSPAESRTTRVFKPLDTVNWLRARIPEANTLRTDSQETENYLFYRGIGNFTPGLRSSISVDEVLHLENQTGGDIPYLLVFQQNAGRVSWRASGSGLKSGAAMDVPEEILAHAADGFPAAVYESIENRARRLRIARFRGGCDGPDVVEQLLRDRGTPSLLDPASCDDRTYSPARHHSQPRKHRPRAGRPQRSSATAPGSRMACRLAQNGRRGQLLE